MVFHDVNRGKPMNGNNSTTGVTPEKLPDPKTLARQWTAVDWTKVKSEVNRLQTRIAKAGKKTVA